MWPSIGRNNDNKKCPQQIAITTLLNERSGRRQESKFSSRVWNCNWERLASGVMYVIDFNEHASGSRASTYPPIDPHLEEHEKSCVLNGAASMKKPRDQRNSNCNSSS